MSSYLGGSKLVLHLPWTFQTNTLDDRVPGFSVWQDVSPESLSGSVVCTPLTKGTSSNSEVCKHIALLVGVTSPINPHVRLFVGRSVSVEWSVIIFFNSREVTLPRSFGDNLFIFRMASCFYILKTFIIDFTTLILLCFTWFLLLLNILDF